ncbi:uncharacterized protein mRpL50 isoform X1 [Panulirus ornatus]|uniref:uncharacterized protein mRpL50 isoform X1 n=1 Tax=Panulirus ornatus TaxID=150431 RepID=UPI003A8B9CC2
MAASIRNIRLLQSNQPIRNQLSSVSFMKFKDLQQHRLSSSAPDTLDENEHPPQHKRLNFDATSLAARGYLRSQKPYDPPEDVENQVLEFCLKLLKSTDLHTPFKDQDTKFHLLMQCSKAFRHSVPNSLLHKINNVGELLTFYKTPVNSTVPLDRMKDIDLPKNLHVIYKYTRFHPETDTKFGGVTAFTKDSTVVSGLKNKKRYPGFTARTSWPYQ